MGGTYADYFNDHYDGPVDTGPVRITIARGEQRVDAATGRTYAPDSWLDEDLMEFDREPDAERVQITKRPPVSLVNALARFCGLVWVLDTCVRRNKRR